MSELPEIAQGMLDPKAYPDSDSVSRVEMMQTQMSFVFLTDEFVYKIKKPVDLGFVDYTTLEQRYFYCQREVELNQRLCPETYLGVVSIIRKKDMILLENRGEAIEYAVKMRRLPQEAMMNVLLNNNGVTLEMVAHVAEKLAAFHRTAETSDKINVFGSLDTINQNTDENFSQTIKYIGNTISQERYRNIKSYTTGFIASNAPLFDKRIADGKIRDCHGDLHAAHICFTDDILIYDCIEFNDRFRYCDVASEIAFLAMDLDNYDRPDLSRGFVDAYVSFSQDTELLELLDFYKCYRAYVRGKVESFKLDDPHISDEEKAKTLTTARNYFELAESYI
jgi:aminoglycoside phosphotransferase family enzyme